MFKGMYMDETQPPFCFHKQSRKNRSHDKGIFRQIYFWLIINIMIIPSPISIAS